MAELLQHIDFDYYRSAQLLVARADLERLRRERSTCADVKKPGKMPPGASPSAITNERR
jgi:hypothetical protein